MIEFHTLSRQHIVMLASSSLPQADTTMASVTFFKALADPVRLRIVHLLIRQDELCVCHFVQVLELPQSSISRHLSTLRGAGLVSSRRDGLWIHYRLAITADSPYAGFITELAKLNQIEPLLADDSKRVQHISC